MPVFSVIEIDDTDGEKLQASEPLTAAQVTAHYDWQGCYTDVSAFVNNAASGQMLVNPKFVIVALDDHPEAIENSDAEFNDAPEDEPMYTRVSTFSAFRGPEHTLVETSHVKEFVATARNEQLGVVISSAGDDPPTEWKGPGVEDRR
jgi:hypothetical protein